MHYAFKFSGGCRSSRDQVRTTFPRTRRTDLPIGAPKNFSGEISARVPTALGKFKLNCAGFVLTKKFYPSRANSLRPFIRNPLLLRKIARGRHDQAGLDRVEKSVGARIPGMMLPFDENVTAQINSGLEQRFFRRVAAVEHE